MAYAKAPHHMGTHQARAKALKDQADANPDTRCWRCGRTLAEHPPTKTGNPPKWSAGHVNDGQIDGPYAPEVLSCNSRAGVLMRNERRRRAADDIDPVIMW